MLRLQYQWKCQFSCNLTSTCSAKNSLKHHYLYSKKAFFKFSAHDLWFVFGSCELKKICVRGSCQSITLINLWSTFHQHLLQYLVNICLTSPSILGQHLLNILVDSRLSQIIFVDTPLSVNQYKWVGRHSANCQASIN